MAKKEISYESAMEELQLIIKELQAEMVSIDDLTNKVKRAKELVDFCKNKLRNVEEDLGELLN